MSEQEGKGKRRTDRPRGWASIGRCKNHRFGHVGLGGKEVRPSRTGHHRVRNGLSPLPQPIGGKASIGRDWNSTCRLIYALLATTSLAIYPVNPQSIGEVPEGAYPVGRKRSADVGTVFLVERSPQKSGTMSSIVAGSRANADIDSLC